MLAIAQLKSVFVAFALTFAVGRLDGHEWRWIAPRVESQVQRLQQADAEALLPEFCETSIKTVDRVGLTCSTRRLGPAFADVVDDTFHPEGVIYGHFLDSGSEDAAVSGSSAETHPYLWGGTLLLTKQDGKWTPLWYKSAVLTHSCHKLMLPNGREILLCEEEDGGMGHVLHYLYPVDLTGPLDIRKAILVSVDSFQNDCTIHRQEIQSVEWAQATRRLAVTVRTPQWRHSSREVCAGDPPQAKRPSLTSIFEFELTNSGFRAIGRQR
jgi:hypothetical protein